MHVPTYMAQMPEILTSSLYHGDFPLFVRGESEYAVSNLDWK